MGIPSNRMPMHRLLLSLLITSSACFFATVRCEPPECMKGYPVNWYPSYHRVLDAQYLSQYHEVFVIGDVHGCYDELQNLLKLANVNHPKVLIILVGDMLRKGPKNLEVLRFVRNTPNLITVRGNNDDLALRLYHNATTTTYQLPPEDQFVLSFSAEDVTFLEGLPYVISIPPLNTLIVHAGLRPNLPLHRNSPYGMTEEINLIPDSNCTDGYRPFKHNTEGMPWASIWNGPEHVVFGHNKHRGLQMHPYATGIDTGCVYGEKLTGIFIKGPKQGNLVQLNSPIAYFTHDEDE